MQYQDSCLHDHFAFFIIYFIFIMKFSLFDASYVVFFFFSFFENQNRASY